MSFPVNKTEWPGVDFEPHAWRTRYVQLLRNSRLDENRPKGSSNFVNFCGGLTAAEAVLGFACGSTFGERCCPLTRRDELGA
jgi:hypothetical protein